MDVRRAPDRYMGLLLLSPALGVLFSSLQNTAASPLLLCLLLNLLRPLFPSPSSFSFRNVWRPECWTVLGPDMGIAASPPREFEGLSMPGFIPLSMLSPA
jgi:hypothetical protein